MSYSLRKKMFYLFFQLNLMKFFFQYLSDQFKNLLSRQVQAAQIIRAIEVDERKALILMNLISYFLQYQPFQCSSSYYQYCLLNKNVNPSQDLCADLLKRRNHSYLLQLEFSFLISFASI